MSGDGRGALLEPANLFGFGPGTARPQKTEEGVLPAAIGRERAPSCLVDGKGGGCEKAGT